MISWFSWDTIVTDAFAAVGFILVVITPLIFAAIQRRILNGRLHTRVDGEKLFEKLKYDLNLSKLTNVNKRLLYRDVNYARSIFAGAMEYNSRDLLWYFNELHAKNFISSAIWGKAWTHFWVWILTVGVVMGGSYLDFPNWLFQINTMTKVSGIVSICVIFLCTVFFCGIIKTLEFFRIKRVVNDEVRQINLAKKKKFEKTLKSFIDHLFLSFF
ncbi:hypothetical protein SCLARK_00833 [Spiroplasma clarkii]|uniref:hypothetical protein n=1 Tax=Spiroplasma clarkii TaxID=2139 RepID=UPI000B5656E7|nr:hypothetical protein [Spiroplasma clarkii]ARU91452.1 hypothetical protein SCLARK_00833 [Spiroplasma clarkii]